MIPAVQMSSGYPRTLQEIREALEKRVKNGSLNLGVGPVYHRGTPDPSALPDEKIGIWLDWDGVTRDPDEPYEATLLVTTWRIYIVAKDEGTDNFGGSSPLAEQVWGGILKTLTDTNTSLSLEGAVDFVPTPEAAHFRGAIAGGNRRVEVIEMTVECHHQQELVRCPP